MDIELIPRRNLICGAEMQQVPGSAALGKVAHVFDERIHGFGELPVQQKSGLAGQIASGAFGGPVKRELPRERPIR